MIFPFHGITVILYINRILTYMDNMDHHISILSIKRNGFCIWILMLWISDLGIWRKHVILFKFFCWFLPVHNLFWTTQSGWNTSLKQHKPPKLSNCNSFLFGNTTDNTKKGEAKSLFLSLTTISDFSFHRSDLTSSFIWDLNQLTVHPATWRTCVAKTIPWKKHCDLVICWMTEIDGGWILDKCWNLFVVLFGWQEGIGAQPLIFPEEILFWPGNDMISRCLKR